MGSLASQGQPLAEGWASESLRLAPTLFFLCVPDGDEEAGETIQVRAMWLPVQVRCATVTVPAARGVSTGRGREWKCVRCAQVDVIKTMQQRGFFSELVVPDTSPPSTSALCSNLFGWCKCRTSAGDAVSPHTDVVVGGDVRGPGNPVRSHTRAPDRSPSCSPSLSLSLRRPSTTVANCLPVQFCTK